MIYFTEISTPLGPMVAAESNGALCLLEFSEKGHSGLSGLAEKWAKKAVHKETGVLKAVRIQLKEYFAGQRRDFRLPITTCGTEFQLKTWKALTEIPYGKTRSYSEQARLVGKPAARRAVGRANGQNRIAIVLPCHRVIGANKKPVGYGGGLWRKKFLLDLESGRP